MRYLRIGGDGVHRVAYGEVTPEDRAALDGYIEQLAARADRDLQPVRADGVLDQSLQCADRCAWCSTTTRSRASATSAARRARWSGGPWDEKLVEVNGTPVSLNDIVHRILRPIWHDPRVHYALSCAALGCAEPAAGALSRAIGSTTS